MIPWQHSSCNRQGRCVGVSLQKLPYWTHACFCYHMTNLVYIMASQKGECIFMHMGIFVRALIEEMVKYTSTMNIVKNNEYN